MFVFLVLIRFVQVTQVTRILLYQQTLKNAPLTQVVEQNAKDEGHIAKGLTMNPEAAAKNATT